MACMITTIIRAVGAIVYKILTPRDHPWVLEAIYEYSKSLTAVFWFYIIGAFMPLAATVASPHIAEIVYAIQIIGLSSAIVALDFKVAFVLGDLAFVFFTPYNPFYPTLTWDHARQTLLPTYTRNYWPIADAHHVSAALLRSSTLWRAIYAQQYRIAQLLMRYRFDANEAAQPAVIFPSLSVSLPELCIRQYSATTDSVKRGHLLRLLKGYFNKVKIDNDQSRKLLDLYASNEIFNHVQHVPTTRSQFKLLFELDKLGELLIAHLPVVAAAVNNGLASRLFKTGVNNIAEVLLENNALHFVTNVRALVAYYRRKCRQLHFFEALAERGYFEEQRGGFFRPTIEQLQFEFDVATQQALEAYATKVSNARDFALVLLYSKELAVLTHDNHFKLDYMAIQRDFFPPLNSELLLEPTSRLRPDVPDLTFRGRVIQLPGDICKLILPFLYHYESKDERELDWDYCISKRALAMQTRKLADKSILIQQEEVERLQRLQEFLGKVLYARIVQAAKIPNEQKKGLYKQQFLPAWREVSEKGIRQFNKPGRDAVVAKVKHYHYVGSAKLNPLTSASFKQLLTLG